MRKISEEAARAFVNRKKWRKANTEVTANSESVTMYLHGNLIALMDTQDRVWMTFSGWYTPTTRDRLMAVFEELEIPVHIFQKKGVVYVKVKQETPYAVGETENPVRVGKDNGFFFRYDMRYKVCTLIDQTGEMINIK